MLTSYNISQLLIAVGIIGCLSFTAYYLVMSSRAKAIQRKALGREMNLDYQKQLNIYAQKSYNRLSRIPVVNKLVASLRKRIETLSIYDEYTLRREVMKMFFTILTVIGAFIIALLLFRPGWLVVFWIFLGITFITGLLIDFFVHRVETKLLKQLKEYNNRVRFFYQQTKMVDDSIYDSIQFTGPEMKIQAEKIHSILTAIGPKKELAKYEEVAPTRFLKVIAGLSLQVKEQGDKVTEKGSAYLRALAAINQELNNEILYRAKLYYKLRSLSTLALIPVFFAQPLKNWSVSTFPVMKTFYDSQIGFLAEVAVYATSLAVYFIIRKMRDVNETVRPMNTKRSKWEEKLLTKVPLLRKLALAFTPKPYTKNFFKLKQLIKEANSPLKMEWIALHKILFAVATFILIVGGLIFAHYREEHSTLYTALPDTLFAGKVREAERQLLVEQTAFDREVIEKLKNGKLKLSEDNVKAYIASYYKSDVTQPKVITTYERIQSKWHVVENAFLKWWEVLITVGLAFAASYIPILNLKFLRALRRKEMEIEVHQHLVLISSLREFESMSVYIILEWMERFSIVFKRPVQICLHEFDSGPNEALTNLKETVTFEPFQQIVERLELALIRISIKEAFDDIDIEREFHLEQRKESQERSIAEKSSIGNLISFGPLMVLILLYLVIPLIYISVVETGNMVHFFNIVLAF